MQKLILSLLAFFAQAIIKRHKPYVIGVTGTIGKTTLTTYIASYLKLIYGEKNVLISPYHYNGEYGLPLTIIGAKTGGKNLFLWIIVFLKALWTYIWIYPRYIVLEYGIDHPGEMEYLISIVKPDIALLSPIAPNHLEQFGTLEKYREAKHLLVKSAKERAIIHESEKEHISGVADLMYYGVHPYSDAHILSVEQSLIGIHANIECLKEKYEITLPSFGAYQAENILPVYLIASLLATDTALIAKNAHLFTPEEGRSRILEGKNNATIIDGSYNGGYESICRGIDSLVPFLSTHRIICLLGDMRELGDHAAKVHTDLAEYIGEKFSHKGDVSLYLVGPLMERYILPVVKKDLKVETSLSSRTLGKEIGELLERDQKPTIIYVKGSQNTIFLEEGIKEFLASSEDSRLLTRQSSEWMRKKEGFFKNL